jgi:GxxExxY protein
MKKMTNFLHKEPSYTVRGVLFDVHSQLGPLLPEKFYQTAVAAGLENKGIHCVTEKQFDVYYHGVQVGRYFTDICIENGKLILELKVAPEIMPIHWAQLISYLKVTGADIGYVVNFGQSSLTDERIPNFLNKKTPDFIWQDGKTYFDTPDSNLTSELVKILHQVHFELGPGFLHQVYRRAVMVTLRECEIGYKYIKEIPLFYQNTFLGNQETRLICVENKILLATIAVKSIDDSIKQRLRTRMKYLQVDFGLIANFNSKKLEIKLINNKFEQQIDFYS